MVCLIWITEIHPHYTDIFKIKTPSFTCQKTWIQRKNKQIKTKQKRAGWGWSWLQTLKKTLTGRTNSKKRSDSGPWCTNYSLGLVTPRRRLKHSWKAHNMFQPVSQNFPQSAGLCTYMLVWAQLCQQAAQLQMINGASSSHKHESITVLWWRTKSDHHFQSCKLYSHLATLTWIFQHMGWTSTVAFM